MTFDMPFVAGPNRPLYFVTEVKPILGEKADKAPAPGEQPSYEPNMCVKFPEPDLVSASDPYEVLASASTDAYVVPIEHLVKREKKTIKGRTFKR